MTKVRIPQTDSIQELAQFWDTHDLTEFEDELEEVQEIVFEAGDETKVTIQLAPQEGARLARLADERGVAPADLLREWVREKLTAV